MSKKLRDAIEAELKANKPDKKRNIAKLKAQAVADAWATHPGRLADGSMDLHGVRVVSMTMRTTDDGTAVIEVYVNDPANQDPHYRIINPPSLVPDASGDIELGGQRYREDPVAAVATLIARAGGGRKVGAK